MTTTTLLRVRVGVRVGVRGQSMRTFSFGTSEITIGRTSDNDVVLDDASVSAHHARILARNGRLILVDLKSEGGTTINDRRLVQPTIFDEDDTIGVGAYELTVALGEAPCATERAFLDAIEARPSDEEVRVVYADWLEERGRLDAAEMLRAQLAIKRLSPEDPSFQELARRIDELGPRLPRVWRRTVARPAIETCDLRFEVACPQRWDALAPTDSLRERFCGACKRNVVYASTIADARRLARLGRCVAVDVPAKDRSPGDLEFVEMLARRLA